MVPMSTTPSTPSAGDPVTRFLSRFGLRDVGHFLVPGLLAFGGLLRFTSVSDLKASAIAAVPAAGAVIFRQLFPHTTVSATELNTAASAVEKALGKVPALAAVDAVVTKDAPAAVKIISEVVPAQVIPDGGQIAPEAGNVPTPPAAVIVGAPDVTPPVAPVPPVVPPAA